MKHLKTDKQSHLSGDCTKKQATIFGSDCAQRVKLQQLAVKRNIDGEEMQYFCFGMMVTLMRSLLSIMMHTNS